MPDNTPLSSITSPASPHGSGFTTSASSACFASSLAAGDISTRLEVLGARLRFVFMTERMRAPGLLSSDLRHHLALRRGHACSRARNTRSVGNRRRGLGAPLHFTTIDAKIASMMARWVSSGVSGPALSRSQNSLGSPRFSTATVRERCGTQEPTAPLPDGRGTGTRAISASCDLERAGS